jgi:hypothetical protein
MTFLQNLSCSENGVLILAIAAILAIMTTLILIIFILKLIKRNNHLDNLIIGHLEKINKLESELNNCIFKGEFISEKSDMFNTIDPEKCKLLLEPANIDENFRYSLATKTIHKTMLPVTVPDIKELSKSQKTLCLRG